jgi:AraC family transcriptional regulator
MSAISIRIARESDQLVRSALALGGADAELCSYPEVREETLRMIEPEAVLMLGLSRLPDAGGRVADDPRRLLVRFGSLALRPAGVPMEFRIAGGAFDTVRLRFRAWRIAPVLAGFNLDDRLIAACFDIRSAAIEEAMLRLADELEHPQKDSATLASALVELVLIDLRRYLEQAVHSATRRTGGLSARSLRTAIAMIERPGLPPSIDELAAACHLSRHHFIRCFAQSSGVSPGSAIRRKRIAEAKALLLEERLAIGQIARKVGYSGAPALCAAFRRETGRTPSAWRSQMR